MFSDRPENHDDKRSDGNVSTDVTIAMLELVNTVCMTISPLVGINGKELPQLGGGRV